MDFLRIVEDDLRALSVEARKKHPVVKEAAERGIVKLRVLREQYAAAVRELSGESTPPMSMFRSQDLLRPFLLACNHSDCTPKMIGMALGAVAHLINKDAIAPSDAPNIFRVLAIQAVSSSPPEVQVKVLQTLLLTITWRGCDVPEEMFASGLTVCFQLSEHKNTTVRNAASATLRQIISQLFDKVEADEEEEEEIEDLDWSQAQTGKNAVEAGRPKGEPESIRALSRVQRCAYYVIQDLCLLSRGEHGTWLKNMTIPQSSGFELIDQIVSQRPSLFRDKPVFTDVIRNQVCPLIVQTLRSTMDFSLLVRLMRTISTILTELSELLVPQCEVIVAMLLQTLGSDATVTGGGQHGEKDGGGIGSFSARNPKLGMWSVMLSLEVLSGVCQSGSILEVLFRNYDLEPECTNLFAGIIKSLTKVVMDGSNGLAVNQSLTFGATSATWKQGLALFTRGLELTKDSNPPPLVEGDALLNATMCIVAVIESIHRLAIEALLSGQLVGTVPSSRTYQGPSYPGDTRAFDVKVSPGALYHAMLVKDDVWRDLYKYFVYVFNNSTNDRLVETSLIAFEKFCMTLALLNVTVARQQAFGLLCKLAVPTHSSDGLSSGGQGSHTSAAPPMTWRTVRSILALFRLVHHFGNTFGEYWSTLVNTLDMLDASLLMKRMDSSFESIIEEVKLAMRRFVTFSACLEDAAVLHLTAAYASLSRTLVSAEIHPPRVPEGEPQASGASATALASPVDSSVPRSVTAASFLLRHFVKIASFNIYRVEVIWEVVEEHLSFISSCRNFTLRQYGVSALAEVVIRALGRSDEALGIKDRLDAAVGYINPRTLDESVANPSELDAVFNVRTELERLPGRRKSLFQEELQTKLLATWNNFGRSRYLDTREKSLNALYKILQSSGHVLENGWPAVFDLLRSVALGGEVEESVLDVSKHDFDDELESVWGETCLPLAFRSLKLIVDDFLDSIPRQYFADCISCMGAFGLQLLDVNISLTAVEKVWTVADFSSAASTEFGEQIWDAIFAEMSKLAVDLRMDVRNCAVNTLFSCIVGHGMKFPMYYWERRIFSILDLLHSVEEKARVASLTNEEGVVPKIKKGVKVIMHHSRDTASKQWSETRVLTMQGVGRLLRAFIKLLKNEPWFEKVWTRILGFARDATLLGSMGTEVAFSGIQLLFLMLQLVSKSGLAVGPIRAAVGMKVVDGALIGRPLEKKHEAPDGKEKGGEPELSKEDRGESARQKEILWDLAWKHIQSAAEYLEDTDGEIANAFAMSMQQTYEAGKSTEFSSAPHILEYLKITDSLAEARVPVSYRPGIRSGWRPQVLSCQREVLNIFKKINSELIEVWELIFDILKRYTEVMLGVVTTREIEEGQAGQYTTLPMSVQFSKEASECLVYLYTDENVPAKAKAIVFDRLLSSIDGPCLKCVANRRNRSRHSWAAALKSYMKGDPNIVTLHPQPVQFYIDAGNLSIPLIEAGLHAVASTIDTNESLSKAWDCALLAVEGLILPWLLEPAPNNEGEEASNKPAPHGEGESYADVKVRIMGTSVEAVLAKKEALDERVFDRLIDLLADVVIGETACSMRGSDSSEEAMPSEGLPGWYAAFAVTIRAALGHLQRVQLFLMVGLTKNDCNEKATLRAMRRLFLRLAHTACWVLQMYILESRKEVNEVNTSPLTYRIAEANALLFLESIKSYRTPVIVLDPKAIQQVAEWIFPTDTAAEEGQEVELECSLDSLMADESRGRGLLFAISEYLFLCINTSSVPIRSLVADLLQSSNVAKMIGDLRSQNTFLHDRLAESESQIKKLETQVQRLTAASASSFF